MTPAPRRDATMALPKHLQRAFDRMAEANLEGTAKRFGVSEHIINALMYGGKVKPETMERVRRQMET